MMKLYSNSTDPFSHRCRIVLFEKGMDFEVIDVDLNNKAEDVTILSHIQMSCFRRARFSFNRSKYNK